MRSIQSRRAGPSPSFASSMALRGHWCGKAGVDDRRRDLIPVLRLAFGLYLQRRELDKGAPSEAGDLASPRHASSFADLHAPGAQGRPLAAAEEERMSCLVKSGAGELVAATANPADDVRLTGLIARRRQPEMGADVTGVSEALRLVDCGPKASAVIGPTPGTLISRRQISS